jgi:PhnB protein
VELEPYLFFPGNCEEALAFYGEVFSGKIVYAMRYDEVPEESHDQPAGWEKKIMHATFVAGPLKLMASDSMQQKLGTHAERVALSVGTPDPDEGRRIFDALSAGGTVVVPYSKQFWGASFGMITDRFGIDWMINAGGP